MDSVPNPCTSIPAANINPSTSNASNTGPPTVERRCDKVDCNVAKLVSMVPSRKAPQFVTDPGIMEKPLLINGFTTVFQVDGNAAKLHDLKDPSNMEMPPNNVIYRIVPNTHAHIVNYVVVDAEGESLRKINEGDPATMRKLLESQKVSAEQMLKKLMVGHNNSRVVDTAYATNGAAAQSATTNVGNGPINTEASLRTAPVTVNKASAAANNTMPHTSNASTYKPISVDSSQHIQLPLRVHPNLKITAVASAETVGALGLSPTFPMPAPSTKLPPPLTSAPSKPKATQKKGKASSRTTAKQAASAKLMASSNSAAAIATSSVPLTTPLITPVPLATLQATNATTVPISRPSAGATTSTPATLLLPIETVEKPIFDKMQAELQELRRTVALLAEAQAKNSAAATKRANQN